MRALFTLCVLVCPFGAQAQTWNGSYLVEFIASDPRNPTATLPQSKNVLMYITFEKDRFTDVDIHSYANPVGKPYYSTNMSHRLNNRHIGGNAIHPTVPCTTMDVGQGKFPLAVLRTLIHGQKGSCGTLEWSMGKDNVLRFSAAGGASVATFHTAATVPVSSGTKWVTKPITYDEATNHTSAHVTVKVGRDCPTLKPKEFSPGYMDPFAGQADMRPGAHLENCDLRGRDLSGYDLTGAKLYNANLTGANLTKATLVGADFTNAYLSGADLSGADLKNAIIQNTRLDGIILVGGKTPTLETIVIVGATSGGVKGQPSRYGIKEGRTITAKGYIVMPGANLVNANLENARLQNADLTNANLTNANLTNANLTNANLDRSDLSDAWLTGADVTGATLKNAITTGGTRMNNLIGKKGAYPGKSPGMSFTNHTMWPVQVSLNDVANIACNYHKVIQPGATHTWNTGGVWFNITASASFDGKERSDWECIVPIALTVGQVMLAAATGGTSAATGAFATGGAKIVAKTAAQEVASQVVISQVKEVGRTELNSWSAVNLGQLLLPYSHASLNGQYAGDPLADRCTVMPTYSITGGPTVTDGESYKAIKDKRAIYPGWQLPTIRQRVLDVGTPMVITKTNTCGDGMARAVNEIENITTTVTPLIPGGAAVKGLYDIFDEAL